MSGKRIRVLIVDDAQFMRKTLAQIVSADPSMEVVGYAKSGKEALDDIRRLRPDVVTLDIDMPEMDGIRALRRIMIYCPTPVVVVSALTQQGDVTFEALRLGVVDFLPKPSGSVSGDMESQKEMLIHRIKAASTADVARIRRARIERGERVDDAPATSWTKDRILLIGGSLGGPNNVIRLISTLPADFPIPIVVMLDISPLIVKSFVEKFDSVSPLSVREAHDDITLAAATVYIGSLDRDISFVRDGSGDVSLQVGPLSGKPIDNMMISGAELFGRGAIGILFAGIKRDGVEGLQAVKRRGGVTVLKRRDDYFLPDNNQEIMETGIVNHNLSAHDMSHFIIDLGKRR